MSLEEKINIMKNDSTIGIVKVGIFFRTYGKDTYLMSYLFNYQIGKSQGNINECAFPESSLNSVINRLKEEKINYAIFLKEKEYVLKDEKDFRDENRYNEMYDKSYKYTILKNKVADIHNYLMSNIDAPFLKDKLNKIEDIIFFS